MIRPEQHVTDEQGNIIFRAAFANWGVNPSEKDYGLDYVVEVFDNGSSTGVRFNAQLKSSLHTAYSSDNSFISQSLKRDAADYLARQLQQPTFLFHADVQNKKLFWSAIQIDEAVLAALASGDADSLTVRILTSNVLPDNRAHFLLDLTRSDRLVASRTIMATSHFEFADSIRGQPVEKISEFADSLHKKAFYLTLQAAHQEFKIGKYPEAIKLINDVLASSTASTEVRFDATLQLGQVETVALMKSDEPQIRAAERKLATAQELCHIVRKGPNYLRLVAILTRKAAELGMIIQKYHGLAMIWKGHRLRGEDPLWVAVLSFRINQTLIEASRKYNQTIRLAKATAKSRYRWVTARPLIDSATEAAKLAILLKSAGFDNAALQYRNSAFELFKAAATIAIENKDSDQLLESASYALLLEESKTGEIYAWARSILDGWPEGNEYRRAGDEILRRFLLRKDGVEFKNDIQASARQIHQNILSSFKIDPTVQPWADLINLAVKDSDPTRVLKSCKSKIAAFDPTANPLLVKLGLEHANPKILHCLRHGHAVSGPDLDGINQVFEQRYCNSCVDRTPRSPEWKYSDEWVTDAEPGPHSK